MKDSFILFTAYKEHLKLLSDEQVGVLFRAIFAFMSDEDLPEMDGITHMAFSFISADLNRSEEKYKRKAEASRENGRLGGRPKKPQTGEENTAEIAEEKPSENPNNLNNQVGFTGSQDITQKPTGLKKTLYVYEHEYDYDLNITHTARAREDGSACKNEEEIKELPSLNTEEFQEQFEKFRRRWNISVDSCSPLIRDFDFDKLNQAYERSAKWLQRYSTFRCLSWIVKNYSSIIAGKYDDHAREQFRDKLIGDPDYDTSGLEKIKYE